MTDRELLEMALDTLEKIGMGGDPRWADDVAPILHARLAQPEPEPVAWTPKIERLYDKNGFLLHQKIKRTPSSEWEDYYPEPQREWQGLTDEEIKSAWSQLWYDLGNGKFAASDDSARHTTIMFAKEIEAKLKEKNT